MKDDAHSTSRTPPEILGVPGVRIRSMVEHVGKESTRKKIAEAIRTPLIAVLAFVIILGGLGISVVVVSGVAAGIHAGTGGGAPDGSAATRAGKQVSESMEIETGKMDGRPGWPRFTNAFWSVKRGDTVVLTITSHDDGAAPLQGSQAGLFDRVRGTLGGIETVDGRRVSQISNKEVAHTFTIPALDVNVVIPAAPSGGTVTVVARFTPSRTGVFVWQCYAPCGMGMNSMGGAMSTMGWMEGKVTVLA
ncbi:MAG: cupredoxin domain-containing protein [Acidimicrobiales bacterium]